MPSAGQRMEVLTKTGLRHQSHKIIIQPSSQLVISVHLESTCHQPGGVEPRRAAPIAPGFVAGIGQIKARDTLQLRRPNSKRLAGGRLDQRTHHLRRQTRQN